MGFVFAKTTKGIAELEKRSGLLTSRARRALIFVDGKRSVDELAALLQADNLRLVLGQLEEDGFIEYLDSAPAPAQPAPAAVAPALRADPPPEDAAAARFTPLPDSSTHPKRLRAARTIMRDGILGYVGPQAAASLLKDISDAATLAELRTLYDRWQLVMAASLASEWEKTDLRDKLLRVI